MYTRFYAICRNKLYIGEYGALQGVCKWPISLLEFTYIRLNLIFKEIIVRFV